jgi:hypothetical protein
MRQKPRTAVCVLIAIAALLMGTLQLAEAQNTRIAETIQVDTSLRRRPPRPRPKPPVRSVPEPSASLCLGMALFALAGYGWWSQKKNQAQH